MMECPFCGYKFDENRNVDTCQGCPLGGNCNLVKCPNCGYEMPRQSRLLKTLRALKRRVK